MAILGLVSMALLTPATHVQTHILSVLSKKFEEKKMMQCNYGPNLLDFQLVRGQSVPRSFRCSDMQLPGVQK